MEWLSRTSKRLILEMSVGVILYNLILAVLAFFALPRLSYPFVPVLMGLLVGAVSAIAMLIHMGVMTERALESQNENYANKTTMMHSMIRRLVLIAVFLVCYQKFHMDLLAAVIGAMGMKAGAFLQPAVHKVFSRKDTSAD